MSSGIVNVDLECSPGSCLRGAHFERIQSDKQQSMITLAVLAAKPLILLNRKVRKPTSFSRDSLLGDLLHLLSIEEATSILRDLYVDTSMLLPTFTQDYGYFFPV